MKNIKLTNLLNNNGQIEGLPKNPRLIKDERFEKLKKSIQDDPEMLQLRELLVYPYNDKFIVIGGNMRLKAMKELGYKEAPCKVIDASTPPEKLRAYTIKDNVGYGEHDIDLLANDWDVEELKDWGVEDIDFEIENIEPEETEGDDDIPESAPAITVKGDLYELGEHRLLCGDSTLIDDVEKLMEGEKADMVFTDPPYNVASDSSNFAADKSKAMNDLKESEWDKNFVIEDFLANLPIIKAENCTFYIWTSHYLAGRIWEFFKEADHSSYLVWSKPNPMPSLSKRHPTWNTELCCYFSFGSNRVVNFPNSGHFFSCREVIKKSDGSHPTQKPIELIEPIILFNSNKKQLIFDGFLGSGSTLIACEKTNRKCYGMELDEKYCDVIVKRYIDFCKKNDRPVSVKRNGEDCLKDFESNIE